MASKFVMALFSTAAAANNPPPDWPQLRILHRDCGTAKNGTQTTHALTSSTQPNIIDAGQATLVKVLGNVDKDVSSVHINATMDVRGAKFSACEGDGTSDVMCAHNIANVTLHPFDLPIKKGELHVAMHVNTDPVLAPVVPFNVRIEATDEASGPLLCVDMTVSGSCGVNFAPVEAPTPAPTGQHVEYVEAEDDVQTIGHMLRIPADPKIDQHPYHDDFCQQPGNFCVEKVDNLVNAPSWGASDVVEIPDHAQKMAGSLHKVVGVRGSRYQRSLVCHRIDAQTIGCHPEHDMVNSLWELTTEMSQPNSSRITTGTLYMMCHLKLCHVTQPGSMMVVPPSKSLVV